jgi:hypothetical protein
MRDTTVAALARRLRLRKSDQGLEQRLYFKSASLDLHLQMALSYGLFGGVFDWLEKVFETKRLAPQLATSLTRR